VAKAIRDIDRGFGRILKGLAEMKDSEVTVGLQAGDKTKDGKHDVAWVAGIQEFGLPERNIPARPFMRDTCDEKELSWRRTANTQVGRFVDGKIEITEVLNKLGEKVQKDVQRKIVDGPFVPNAPYTVFKKLSKSRHGILRAAARYIGDGQSKNMGKRMNKITGLEGATTPLVDTGRMRQSIRYVVRKRGSGKVNQ
jgi:hypothetical protein